MESMPGRIGSVAPAGALHLIRCARPRVPFGHPGLLSAAPPGPVWWQSGRSVGPRAPHAQVSLARRLVSVASGAGLVAIRSQRQFAGTSRPSFACPATRQRGLRGRSGGNQVAASAYGHLDGFASPAASLLASEAAALGAYVTVITNTSTKTTTATLCLWSGTKVPRPDYCRAIAHFRRLHYHPA
jgi:hypothetical protein